MKLPIADSLKKLKNTKQRLRVAVLNRVFSPTGGGAERYSIALVEQLSHLHDIHVFAQKIDHECPRVTYHRVSMPMEKPRWINQLWFSAATWWATRRGFDVVHSHENTWHGDVQTVHVLPVKYNLFHRSVSKHLILQMIKVITSPRLLTYLFLERIRYGYQVGKHVVLTSVSLQAVMTESYPTCNKMLSVITPGVTIPQLPVFPEKKIEARKILGLPKHGVCLLFVGNDYQKKGLQTLLEALRLLPNDVVLAVVGNSTKSTTFRKQVHLLSIQDRVFFLGALKDMSPAYEAADCLVHPTREDTFAMVVLEAMAYGLPVIVSSAKYCGISNLLQHGINAMILDEPKDTNNLVIFLKKILEEKSIRKQLEHGAIAFASNYEWQKIALKQEAIYFSVVAEKKVVN